MSKYLIFEHKTNQSIFKGNKVTVMSKVQKSYVGEITFYPAWNQYVFEAISNAVFNDECLEDIVKEIKTLKAR